MRLTVAILAAEGIPMEADGFRITGSNFTWDTAVFGPRGGCRISRIVADGDWVRQINRWVHPETGARLVRDLLP